MLLIIFTKIGIVFINTIIGSKICHFWGRKLLLGSRFLESVKTLKRLCGLKNGQIRGMSVILPAVLRLFTKEVVNLYLETYTYNN